MPEHEITRQRYIELVQEAAKNSYLTPEEEAAVFATAATIDRFGVGTFQPEGEVPACTWTLSGNVPWGLHAIAFGSCLDASMDQIFAAEELSARLREPDFYSVSVID